VPNYRGHRNAGQLDKKKILKIWINTTQRYDLIHVTDELFLCINGSTRQVILEKLKK